MGSEQTGRSEKDRLGRYGEDLAAQHLVAAGMVLLDRNWRCREGELDAVARDVDGTLVFVEVKWRSNLDYGSPVEAVDQRKQQAIRSMAEQYLAEKEPRYEEIRFDVVGILGGAGNADIEHVKDAF